MTAVDDDIGDFGKVTYTVAPDDLFGVFPDGRVYLQRQLDREETAYHSLTVTARDGGDRSSQATVVIYVTDVNDNRPRFLRDSYVFYLSENESLGTVVGRVTATDADVGRNADLSYKFTSNTDYFVIYERTGLISSAVTILVRILQ